MKQYLKYWCSPDYPGDPSNDPPESVDPTTTTIAVFVRTFFVSVVAAYMIFRLGAESDLGQVIVLEIR